MEKRKTSEAWKGIAATLALATGSVALSSEAVSTTMLDTAYVPEEQEMPVPGIALGGNKRLPIK